MERTGLFAPLHTCRVGGFRGALKHQYNTIQTEFNTILSTASVVRFSCRYARKSCINQTHIFPDVSGKDNCKYPVGRNSQPKRRKHGPVSVANCPPLRFPRFVCDIENHRLGSHEPFRLVHPASVAKPCQ